MLRAALLIAGLLIVINQHWLMPLQLQQQMVVFLAGIVVLGIPHGSADLLISIKDANDNKKAFSYVKFFINYLGRLFAFLAFLIIFPLPGMIAFILMASFHFGETDLYQFKSNSLLGRVFLISYGLLVINVILLVHFDEVKPLFLLFEAGRKNLSLIELISQYRFVILSVSMLTFFISAFCYFLFNHDHTQSGGQFLINLCVIIVITFNLPMLMGFTFYFVLWHSVLSLKNIISYLRQESLFSFPVIFKQIGFYSLLASAGVCLVGMGGFMFTNNNAMASYIFLGLAVLTAPHMQIMHNMYTNIRQKKYLEKTLPISLPLV
jgi:Brp/Blh family beta-carotene 15,15'-monooxygenase